MSFEIDEAGRCPAVYPAGTTVCRSRIFTTWSRLSPHGGRIGLVPPMPPPLCSPSVGYQKHTSKQSNRGSATQQPSCSV
jgi:hypothetical protein